MFDVMCYWEWRSTRLNSVRHRRPPTSRVHSQARNTDLIRISHVAAEYECADWLPASSTCCSSGSRRINSDRSYSARPRVAMLYDRGGRAWPGHAHRPIPAVCFHSSSGRRGASKATTERVARIVCLPERDGRDSDLSCVPNEKRPLSAVDAVIWLAFNAASISQRPNEPRPVPSLLLLALWVVVTIGPLIHAETLITSWVRR